MPESATAEATLLSLPGLGNFVVRCRSAAFSGASVVWNNDTGKVVDGWLDNATDTLSETGFRPVVVGDGGGFVAETSPVSSPRIAYGSTVSLGVGADPGPRKIALVHLFAQKTTDGAPCSAQAIASVWSSP